MVHNILKNKIVIKNNKIQFYLQTNIMRLEKRRLTENDTKNQVVEVWEPAEQERLAPKAFQNLHPL